MKCLTIIFLSLIFQACAGPALYNFKNDTERTLLYSSLSNKWHPDVKNEEITIHDQTNVLFSPEFELRSEDGTRYIYNLKWSYENREEFAELFISKWDASDLLYVLIDDDFRLFLRDKNDSIAKKEQPIRFGFPHDPIIIEKSK